MELIPDELLPQLTPEEAQAYADELDRHYALQSPLNYAEILFPETRRWATLELLDDYLVALCEYRLTKDGPVPAERVQWWYVPVEAGPSGLPVLVGGPREVPEVADSYGAYDPVTGNPIVFNLAVSMMPRAGKSRLITEVLPWWILLHDPEVQIGLATYSDTFARDWGEMLKQHALAHRGEAEEQGFAPLLPLPRDGVRQAADIFRIAGHSGKIRFTGTGGAVTGKTLMARIADDLVKNEEDMLSDAIRGQVQRFITSTWQTRRTRDLREDAFLPFPIEVRMGTRWHTQDPIGFSCFDSETGKQDPKWCVLNIPALCEDEETDPLGRSLGAAHANAAGLTRTDLEEIREDDPRTFAALYQGRPTPEGGGLISTDFQEYQLQDIKGEKYLVFRRRHGVEPGTPPPIIHLPLSECIVYGSADMAATTKTTADWTVLGIFAYSREHDELFILDWYRKRITTDQYISELLPVLQDWGASACVLENITYGQVFGQSLESHRFAVEYADKVQDKVSRAVSSTISNRIRSKKVYALKGAPYLTKLIEETGTFPYDDHDDQVDVLSFASWWAGELPPWVTSKKREAPKRLIDQIEEQVEREAKRRSGRHRRDAYSRLRR